MKKRGGKGGLDNKHGVAKRVEAIVVFDRVVVGIEDLFTAGKGGDEDKQGGLGKMEVGDQSFYRGDVVAWCDKKTRPSFAGFAVEGFENTNSRGTDGDDATTVFFGSVDRFGGGG